MTTPFRITKPGEYRMRNGRKQIMDDVGPNPSTWYPIKGKGRGGYSRSWTEKGERFKGSISPTDIVAPWKPKPRKRRTGKGRRFRNEPQNVTDKCWYYEEPKGLHVVLESPTGGTTLMAVIPWRMIAGSLGRRGGRSRP